MHTVIDLENGNCLVVGEFNREIINDNGVKLVGGETAVVIAKVLLPKDDGWQLIETAPKDGTQVIVYRPKFDGGYIPKVGVDWWGMFSYKWGWAKSRADCQPTHWRPLPVPPASTAPTRQP